MEKEVAQSLPFFAKPMTMLYSFYLTTVGSPEQYHDWCEAIRMAGENDIVRIHINSPGGNLNSTIQLMRAIQDSPATVITSVEGECMSAATMIFLSGDMAEISEHSMFMFHNYSGGTIGKGGEMLDQLQYQHEWSNRLFREVYEAFLTEEEIDLMVNGKDLWMTGEEVTERLNQRAEFLSIKLAEQEGDNEEEDNS